jgi:hypothetical protein
MRTEGIETLMTRGERIITTTSALARRKFAPLATHQGSRMLQLCAAAK